MNVHQSLLKKCHSAAALLITAAIALSASGCVESQKVTLNEVSLSGPVAKTPVYVTIDPTPGTFQVMPAVAIGNSPHVKGSIDPSGSDLVSPTIANPGPASPQGNLSWEIPGNEYDLDIQYIASRHVALTAGGTYATTGSYQFTDFRGGIGFFTSGNPVEARLDLNLQFNSLRYRSRSIVTTIESQFLGSDKTYVSHFDDSGVMQPIGTSASLTLNSDFPQSVVNGFLSLGVADQPLLNYYTTTLDSLSGNGDRRVDINVKTSTAVFSFAGGVALEVGGGNRALLGIRGFQLLDVNAPVPRPIWQPFIQFVFSF